MKTTRAMAAMALLTSVLATSACGGRQLPEGQEIEPIVHLAGGHIEFNRSCADEEPYTTRAYTLMDSGDGRASALVTVIAGYLPSTGTRVVVGVELVALELHAGTNWGATSYMLKMKARTRERRVQGHEVATYQASEPGEPPSPRRFTTTSRGEASWISFVEPEERRTTSDHTYRFAPILSIPAADLGVDSPDLQIALALVVSDQRSGEEIELKGPSLRIPARVWKTSPPAPKRLGLAATLNPFEEGGLWRTLGRAWKNRKCIDERKIAKQAFKR